MEIVLLTLSAPGQTGLGHYRQTMTKRKHSNHCGLKLKNFAVHSYHTAVVHYVLYINCCHNTGH